MAAYALGTKPQGLLGNKIIDEIAECAVRLVTASQFKRLDEVSELYIKSVSNFTKSADVLYDVNFSSS